MTCGEFFISLIDSFGKFFLTLVGAGVGATAAFLYNRKKQELDDEKRDYADSIAAFYTLVARFSALENFARKYLLKDRTEMDPEHSFSVIYQQTPGEQIPLRTLTCFAEKENSDLIYEISVASASYFDFAEALAERNKDVRSVIDVLHEKGFAVGKPINSDDILEIPESAMALQQTENLYGAVVNARRKTVDVLEKLTKAIHDKFPNYPKVRMASLQGTHENGEKDPGTASP